jgi:hypothetical protein
MATLGAGAGSVILLATALAQPTPEGLKKAKSAASGCEYSTVIASDAATVAETTAGKSVDSDGTAYTFSKVYPTARQPLAPGASCRQSSLTVVGIRMTEAATSSRLEIQIPASAQ